MNILMFILIIGAVVDHGGKIDRRFEDAGKMRALGAARQGARYDHEALGADFLGVPGEGGRPLRILRARSDDDRDARVDEMLDALHALFVGQQRPIAHGAAVDYGGHSGLDQLSPLAGQRAEVGRPVGLAGGHQRRHYAREHVGHGYSPVLRRPGSARRAPGNLPQAAAPILRASLAETRESAQYPRRWNRGANEVGISWMHSTDRSSARSCSIASTTWSSSSRTGMRAMWR